MRAKVTVVTPAQAARIGQLEIVRVYCGPQHLRGRTFTVTSSTGGEDSNGLSLSPALEPGESGIWYLKERNGTLMPVRHPQYGSIWPARERYSSCYAEANALAESIERVAKSTGPAKVPLLKSLATNSTPEVSAWAIHAMADAGLPDAPVFLRQLSRSRHLTLSGQIALDEVLTTEHPAWQRSPERRRLLEGWLRGIWNEDDPSAVFNRWESIIQHGEVDEAMALSLLKTGVENERLPLAARRSAVRLVGQIARRTPNDHAALEQLLAHIRSAREPELRLAAAHALKNFITLDASHAPLVRAAKDQAQDREVAAILGEVLERTPRP